MATMLVDAPAAGAAGGRREQVLRLLRSSDRPLSAAEVAETTGLHLNTARFHLDGLVEGRLAERTSEPRDQPGRPRILYTAQGAAPGPRSYALLAEMLTGLVASLTDVGPAAISAGQAWGRHLIERAAPSQRVDAEEAVVRLNRVLTAIGFEPEVRTSATGSEVRLHHCPFREVAEKHTDVVCAIHLGLMQGALTELQAPIAATSLEPFVATNLCVARLQPATTAPVRGTQP
jgi:predicted ArsR family transcriptional regulator